MGAALRCQRDDDYRLVHIHAGDGWNARRLDHVDGMDADVWTDVGRSSGLVSHHVDRYDGRDDDAIPGPNAVALADELVTPLTLDVTSASQIQRAADQVDSLDLLVNKAVIAISTTI